MTRRGFISAGAVVVVGGVARRPFAAATAGPVTTDAVGDHVQRLPRGRWPAFADTEDTRRLYRYAVEHAAELQYIPCTCGCANIGHGSNRDCYVKASHADGTVTYTSHAAT